MIRKRSPQLALFDVVPQPRAMRTESLAVYSLVLALRSRGIPVFRHGRKGHLVDGRRVLSAKMLKRMVEAA